MSFYYKLNNIWFHNLKTSVSNFSTKKTISLSYCAENGRRLSDSHQLHMIACTVVNVLWTVMKSMIFFICISVQGKNNIPLSYKSCNFEILKMILFNQWNCLTWTWNKITKTWWYFIGWVHFWRKFLQGMWHFCLSIISKYSDLHF